MEQLETLPGLFTQVASDGATQLAEAMCPSGPTKLICSNVLQVWRYHGPPGHIKTLGNQSLQTSQSIQMSPWSGLEPSTDARSLGLRSGVLCTVFVHACFALLDLRFTDHVKTAEARGHEVHFQSSARTFRHLHRGGLTALLCLHVTLLTAADLDGAGHQTLTWIARAVVCQHLRLLEFASGGFVAMSQLPGRAPEAGVQGIIHTLVFASASIAEKLVAKLQLQHRLKRALPDAEHGPVRAAAPTTAGARAFAQDGGPTAHGESAC
ncbi:unnamed protein product [Effrenium voratum]|nr:unnamed protein product [Effrenium voratum]